MSKTAADCGETSVGAGKEESRGSESLIATVGGLPVEIVPLFAFGREKSTLKLTSTFRTTLTGFPSLHTWTESPLANAGNGVFIEAIAQ